MPELVEPYARKTARLPKILELLGFALYGQVGARPLHRVGMAASPSTVLRYVLNATVKPCRIPPIVGVDDVAMLRGRYWTIIVDLRCTVP